MPVTVAIAAGCALVAGGCVLLYFFRKEIKALLKRLKDWIVSACKYLVQLARDILFGLYRATEDMFWSAYQAAEKEWNSLTPEGKKRVLSASGLAIRDGVETITDCTKETFQQSADPDSSEIKVMNDVISKIGSNVKEYIKSTTEMCICI